MLSDGFRRRYTTIPFAIYKNRNKDIGYCHHHFHKEAEILVVVEGAIDFYLGSELYKIEAGEVLFIPPYCPHHSTALPDTYHECIAFDLSLLWDKALARDLENGALTVKSHLTGDLAYTKDVYEHLRASIKAFEDKKEGWEMQVIGDLSIIMSRLMAESFFVRCEKAKLEESFAKRTIEYINEHLSERVTSTVVAEALFLNKSYFCRLFKKTFGSSFTEYLTYRRIEYAKILLKTTDDSVSDIALKCGFTGFSYFSKCFKAITGRLPTKYRQNRENQP